jgi:hypothetical protein
VSRPPIPRWAQRSNEAETGGADGIFSHPDIYAAIAEAGLADEAEKTMRLMRKACDALATETTALAA